MISRRSIDACLIGVTLVLGLAGTLAAGCVGTPPTWPAASSSDDEGSWGDAGYNGSKDVPGEPQSSGGDGVANGDGGAAVDVVCLDDGGDGGCDGGGDGGPDAGDASGDGGPDQCSSDAFVIDGTVMDASISDGTVSDGAIGDAHHQ